MKMLLFVPMSVLLLTGTALFTQAQSQEQKSQQESVIKNEHLLMKNGKMFHTMDGKEMQMQNQMTMKNGIMISPDGRYTLNNGKQRSLRNGQCMDMNGNRYRSQQMFQHKKMGNHGMESNKKHMRMNRNSKKMMGTNGGHH